MDVTLRTVHLFCPPARQHVPTCTARGARDASGRQSEQGPHQPSLATKISAFLRQPWARRDTSAQSTNRMAWPLRSGTRTLEYSRHLLTGSIHEIDAERTSSEKNGRLDLNLAQQERPLRALRRPDDAALSLLPLDDEHLVTHLEARVWVEPEAAEERAHVERPGECEQRLVLGGACLAQAACVQDAGGKRGSRRVRRIAARACVVRIDEPRRVRSFARRFRNPGEPLAGSQQPVAG